MSYNFDESRAASERKKLEGFLKKRSDEEIKAARADEAALKAEEAAGRSSASASTRTSKLKEAARKRGDAGKARAAAASASKSAAASQAKVHEYERKAAERRSKEAAKRERERQKASQADRRRHQAREQETSRQVSQLVGRTAELEDQLARARLAAPEKITVLFMAGAIEGGEAPLHLDREMREIDQKVRLGEYRDQITFETTQATQVSDVIDALNRFDPDVVHFSGHSNDEGLLFEDAGGGLRHLDAKEFALLLQAARKAIRLVVFNSCLSAGQAELATTYVEAAIGMGQAINDDTAKLFAGQFYGSLAAGNSVESAFTQASAHAAIVAQDHSAQPALFAAPGVQPGELVLVAP